MPPKNTEPALDPVLVAARLQAATNLSLAAADADLNARMLEARATDPADPVTADAAQEARAAADAAAEQAATSAKLAGAQKTPDQLVADSDRLQKLKEQLVNWKAEVLIHQDFLDHPEAYGGVDLGGQPINVDQQIEYVRAYQASIAAIEAELAGG